MKSDPRFLQKIQLGLSLFLLVMACLGNSSLQIILSLIMVGLTVMSLRSPTTGQRVQEQIALLKEKGIYPLGKPTDEDVRRLVQFGYRILAIRLYREVHKVPLKQAVDAVNAMR